MKFPAVMILILSFLSLSFMTLKDVNDADELYDRIIASDYRTFARVPGFEERTLAIQPHDSGGDMYVDIYMNDVLEDVVNTASLLMNGRSDHCLLRRAMLTGSLRILLQVRSVMTDGYLCSGALTVSLNLQGNKKVCELSHCGR